MSVRVVLNCNPKYSSVSDLLAFLKERLPSVRGFEGCMNVSVYFDESRSEMMLEEEWLSVEKHQVYMQHIARNGVLNQLAGFLSADPAIKYFSREEI